MIYLLFLNEFFFLFLLKLLWDFIKYVIMWCNNGVLYLCCYYMHDSSFSVPLSPADVLSLPPSSFLSIPLLGIHCRLFPLGCLILVWAACAQNFSRSAQGLWVTEATVRGQAISEICGLPISFPIIVTSVSVHQSQVQMTSSLSDITWQVNIHFKNHSQFTLLMMQKIIIT